MRELSGTVEDLLIDLIKKDEEGWCVVETAEGSAWQYKDPEIIVSADCLTIAYKDTNLYVDTGKKPFLLDAFDQLAKDKAYTIKKELEYELAVRLNDLRKS